MHFPDHFVGAMARSMYGRCLMELEDYAGAEVALTEAYEEFERLVGAEHQYTRTVPPLLVDLYTRWERPEDAERWGRLDAAPDDETG